MDIALTDRGAVYLIFLFWDLFEVIVIYFTVAETKGLTLEEIDEVSVLPVQVVTVVNARVFRQVFQQQNPRKYSVERKFDSTDTSAPGTLVA